MKALALVVTYALAFAAILGSLCIAMSWLDYLRNKNWNRKK